MNEEKVTQEQLQLVSFFLGGEEYALNSKLVQQIIELREITPIPQSPDFMEGVINLRGEIIPIINLHLRLGLEKKPSDEKNRIIIIESRGSMMGFICDLVSRILRISPSQVGPVPRLTKEGVKSFEFLLGVGKLEEGLLLIIDVDKILNEEQRKQLSVKKEEKKILEREVPTLQLVSFSLADEWYALELREVQEVMKLPEITPVPSTPSFIKGVINLRGNIVTVVNIKQFLGLKDKKEEEKERRIMVIKAEEKTCGLLVDSVSQVLRLPESAILPPLSTIEEVSLEYIKGECQVFDKLLILLNWEKIVNALAAAVG